MTNPDDINKAIEELDNWWRRKREDGLEDSYVDDEYQIIKQLQKRIAELEGGLTDIICHANLMEGSQEYSPFIYKTQKLSGIAKKTLLPKPPTQEVEDDK